MKSRHLAAMETWNQRRHWRLFGIFALVLLGLATAAFAQNPADPPARVGHVTHSQGSVVFAPQGEEEWTELPRNRPITVGDRLWTDRGARAEMQLGAATLHIDGESHVGVTDLDDGRAQFVLQQGRVNLRVRELAQGENVEVDTPNLALRALQPGDYRIDVDPRTGQTRVQVNSGAASLFGEGGEAIQMGAGQQAHFAGRFLAQVDGSRQVTADDFGRWASERNRLEDQSIAARHVPRGVVGATQLDQYGNWGQDPTHGAVWYPTVTVENWAPYRYGHWAWVHPWGWTWIDDAPWGFAPFHYGRWTMIGARWAWVPGRMAVRPVYSPALVVFLGGRGGSMSFSSGPAVGWYPLAPGEAWWPVYRTTPRYVSYANFNINLNAYPRHYHNHWWRSRPAAITAVGEDDFRRGRPVYRHWRPLPQHAVGTAHINVVPGRPDWRQRDDTHRGPRLHSMPPATVHGWRGRELPASVRDQGRAQHEQDRLQRDAERAAREQRRAHEHARQQQDVQVQREQMMRRQQEQAGRLQAQREAVQRDAHRHQQEQAARHEHERAQREQERGQREAWRQQREVVRIQQQAPAHVRPVQPQVQAVPQQQVQPVQQATPIGRGHGRGGERAQEREGEGGGRGRGHGQQGGWQR